MNCAAVPMRKGKETALTGRAARINDIEVKDIEAHIVGFQESPETSPFLLRSVDLKINFDLLNLGCYLTSDASGCARVKEHPSCQT